jgi:hypothetical protein
LEQREYLAIYVFSSVKGVAHTTLEDNAAYCLMAFSQIQLTNLKEISVSNVMPIRNGKYIRRMQFPYMLKLVK